MMESAIHPQRATNGSTISSRSKTMPLALFMAVCSVKSPVESDGKCIEQALSPLQHECALDMPPVRRPEVLTLFRRFCSSCGWSFCTSPSCFAAAFRVTGVEPVSNSSKRRSSLNDRNSPTARVITRLQPHRACSQTNLVAMGASFAG